MKALRPTHQGTRETKAYYDIEGWIETDKGDLADNVLWHGHTGPLSKLGDSLRMARARESLMRAGPPLNLLECGCGANPRAAFFDLCSRYTGCDFSSSGLAASHKQLQNSSIPWSLVETDACALPFKDATFSAVYSSHMIYHIRDPLGQRKALHEMLRVTKIGGVVVLIVINPRPLFFPLMFCERVIVDLPVLGHLAQWLLEKLGLKGPLPYNPRPLGWMRQQMAPFGTVDIVVSEIASLWFRKNVCEHSLLGRFALKTFLRLESKYPHLSAWLGNYVQITFTKRQS